MSRFLQVVISQNEWCGKMNHLKRAYSRYITGTLWNIIEYCRGFEDMKNEISSSLKASDIFVLIFYWMCYFWVENLSNLGKFTVCGSQTLNRHSGFQRIGLPNPVFTGENSADNNPIHTTHSKSVHTTCMVSKPLLQNIRRLLDPLNCTIMASRCHNN